MINQAILNQCYKWYCNLFNLSCLFIPFIILWDRIVEPIYEDLSITPLLVTETSTSQKSGILEGYARQCLICLLGRHTVVWHTFQDPLTVTTPIGLVWNHLPNQGPV